MKKIILLILFVIPVVVLSQSTVPQGGTGKNSLPSNEILMGDSALRIKTVASTSLPYQPIGNYLTSETDPIYSISSTSIMRAGTTSDTLTEGSTNLFWTVARFVSELLGGHNAIFGNSTTTNLYLSNLLFNLNPSVPSNQATGATYWDTNNHTLSTVLENGVVLQHGQEMHIYGKNTSGVTIGDGDAVMISSSNGQFTAFALATSTTPAAYAFVGLATQEILPNAFGYVTKGGTVSGINTTGLIEGKPVYVSTTTAGKLTHLYPSVPNYVINVGIVERVHATQGRINVISAIVPKLGDLSDVNGTPLATTGQIPVWNNIGKYFDFTSNISDYVPYLGAIKDVVLGTFGVTSNHSTSTDYYSTTLNSTFENIYDTTGEPTGFSTTTTSTITFDNNSRTFTIAPTGTSYDYWVKGKKFSTTTATSIVIPNTAGQLNLIYFKTNGNLAITTDGLTFIRDGAQIATVYWDTNQGVMGYERHPVTMDWATHYYNHTTRGVQYQGGLTGVFNANRTFSVSSGIIQDEDNIDNIGATTTGKIFYRTSPTVLNFTNATTSWYYYDGANIYYDNGGTLTPATNNNYVAYWVFATTDKNNPIYVLMGQREDTNLTNAQANNLYSSLQVGTFPFPEMKLLYRVIVRNSATPTVGETLDYRTSAISGSTAGPSQHNLLSGLNWASAGHTFDTDLNIGLFNFLGLGASTTNATSTNLFTRNLVIDSLNGLLSATNGVVSAISSTTLPYISNALTKGWTIVGNDSGVSSATSSLYISSIGDIEIGTTTETNSVNIFRSAKDSSLAFLNNNLITGITEDTGKKYPGTGTENATLHSGSHSWSTTNYITVPDDGNYAQAQGYTSYPVSGDSNALVGNNFNFSAIPDNATINGIVVTSRGIVSGPYCATSGYCYAYPQYNLIGANGSLTGTQKGGSPMDGYTNDIKTIGGAVDLWGTGGISVADVKNSNFGIAFWLTNPYLQNVGSPSMYPQVDYLSMQIYYTYSTGGNNQYVQGIANSDGTFKIAPGRSLNTNTALNINSVGNVGIGATTSPYAKLSVSSFGGTQPQFVVASSTGSLATTTSLYIDRYGQIGVGTTSPRAPFHISGDGLTTATTPGFIISRYDTAASAHLQHYFPGIVYLAMNSYRIGGPWIADKPGEYASGLVFDTRSTSGKINIFNVPPAVTTAGQFDPNISTYSKFTILGSGDVGIGSSTPKAKLSVHDTSGLAGTRQLFTVASSTAAETNPTLLFTILGNGNVGVGTSSPKTKLTIDGSGSMLDLANVADSAIYQRYVRPSTVWYTAADINNNGGADFSIYTASANTTFGVYTAGTQRLQIGSTGNVGIATTSPWRTLSVVGTMAVNGLTSAAGTPSTLCLNATTKEVTVNAALTCTVSARDQKTKITPLQSGLATLMKFKPSNFAYIDNTKRMRMGFIADEMQSVDHALGDAYDKEDNARSIDTNAILAVTVKAVQELAQSKGVVTAKRSVEENYQWILIGLLVIWNVGLTIRKK